MLGKALFNISLDLAAAGDAVAQLNIGSRYMTGAGVDASVHQAFEWFERAAESGLADAQYNLALCYARGDGVAKNERESRAWLRRAAAGGSSLAKVAAQEARDADILKIFLAGRPRM